MVEYVDEANTHCCLRCTYDKVKFISFLIIKTQHNIGVTNIERQFIYNKKSTQISIITNNSHLFSSGFWTICIAE